LKIDEIKKDEKIPRIVILKKEKWDKLEEIHEDTGIGRQDQVRIGVDLWIDKYEEENSK
jgi:hypothetical protein